MNALVFEKLNVDPLRFPVERCLYDVISVRKLYEGVRRRGHQATGSDTTFMTIFFSPLRFQLRLSAEPEDFSR